MYLLEVKNNRTPNQKRRIDTYWTLVEHTEFGGATTCARKDRPHRTNKRVKKQIQRARVQIFIQ